MYLLIGIDSLLKECYNLQESKRILKIIQNHSYK